MRDRSTIVGYAEIIENLPQDLQLPMLKLVEAVEKDMREQLAVRRQDFDELRDSVLTLAEAQRQSEARLGRLETAVEELAAAQQRTELRVEELAAAQQRTEVEIRTLATTQHAMRNQLGRVLGRQLEQHYRDKAFAYFGRVLLRTQVLSLQELEPGLERSLSEEELEDVELLDLAISGHVKGHPERPEVILAVEVSSVVDSGDVERALRRAALLRKAGYVVVPTVAGEDVTQGAREVARDRSVFLLQNGRREFWEEALAGALGA